MIMLDDDEYVDMYMKDVYYGDFDWDEEDLGGDMPEEEDFMF